ncbi:MAG: hypothetical protein JWN15_2858 [Firmicutes bacterium]|nr:hypothetical protein [Bacillota bacterium]
MLLCVSFASATRRRTVISTDGSSLWTVLELVFTLFLVFVNGFFVAAEFAIVKVRATRIQQLVEEGNRKAQVAQLVITHLDEHLSATQFGITLASLALGWVGEPAVAHLLEAPFRLLGTWVPAFGSQFFVHTVGFVIAFSLITMLHIVMGELVPKSMAIARAEDVTIWCAKPLRIFYRLFQWPIALLNRTANGVLRRIGVQHVSGHDASHSNEELRMLVSASAAGGHLDETERVLLDNVFDFSERVAREIMVPRNEMACLFTDNPIAESLTNALEAGHSRLPLCAGDKDNILGMIHIRDLFHRHDELTDLREIMRPIMVVPETISISRLLKQFQRQKSRMAILVDEYGGTAGVITLEDLLEEIVGDIQDEFDEEEPAEIQNVGPHIFDVDGAMLLEDAQAQLGLRFEELEGVDTLGGYVLSALGNKPEVGQEVILGEHLFGVGEVEGFRITRVLIKPRPTGNLADAEASKWEAG